jgi:hypothetical protein
VNGAVMVNKLDTQRAARLDYQAKIQPLLAATQALAADTAAEYLRGAAVEWIFHVDATAPELNQNAAHFPLAVARTRTREGRGNAPRLVHDQFEA